VFPTPSAKIAITYKERAIPYTELIQRIMACREILEISPGERVAIIAENRPEWAYAFHAIWQRRGVAVPIDLALPVQDIAMILKDSQPAALFHSGQTLSTVQEALSLAGQGAKLIPLESLDALPLGEETLAEAAPHDMDALAALLYTSGTTGEPKGVMLSYANLDTSLRAVRENGFFRSDDTVITILPLHHILPLQASIIISLYAGCKISFPASLQREDIAATLAKEKVTTFIGVPRLYEMFHTAIMERVRASLAGRVLFAISRRIGSRKLGNILFAKVHANFGPYMGPWVCGGAKADVEVVRDLWALGFHIVEGYGLTETSPIISFNPYNRTRPGTTGRPIINTEVRIVDNEVVARGSHVMLGYYNKPELTAKVIRDGWFYTGDTGFLDRKGYLHVTGRKDELIVLPNGKKIDPETIERTLSSMSPLIREIGVLQRNGQLAAVIYPCEDLLALDILGALQTIREEIIERYNTTVASYRRILQICIATETLPRTRLGKMRRFMLQNFFSGNRESTRPDAQEAIADDVQALLCEYLGKKKGMRALPESRLDFDLTLDSLDRLELASFVQKSFARSLSEMDIAKAESIADLASLVHNAAPLTSANEEAPAEDMPKFRGNSRSIMRNLIVFVVSHCFRIRKQGLENLPEGPCILVANHESYLDIPCLIATLPKAFLARSISWVKASPVMEKVVRCISRGQNMITVHSKKPLGATLQISEAVIESGHNLIIFPEGSRSLTGEIAPFRPGFAMIACKKQVPVVPIAIEGAFEAMPRGKIIPRFGRKIEITITPAIMPFADESDGSLARRAHDRIAELLAHRT